MFSAAFPALYWVLCLFMWVAHWVDRYNLLRVFVPPPPTSAVAPRVPTSLAGASNGTSAVNATEPASSFSSTSKCAPAVSPTTLSTSAAATDPGDGGGG